MMNFQELAKMMEDYKHALDLLEWLQANHLLSKEENIDVLAKQYAFGGDFKFIPQIEEAINLYNKKK